MKNKQAKTTTYIIIFVLLIIIIIAGYLIWNNYFKKVDNPNILNPSQNQIITVNPTNPTTIKPDIQITSTTYPNSILTPGFLLTMDRDFLCIPGTPEKLVVNTTDDIKKQIFENYKIPYPTTKEYQMDRFIPISLGGSNDIKNIWPQSVVAPGFREKDKVENYLYKLMCNKTINISTAQQMIKTDWVKVYREMPTK